MTTLEEALAYFDKAEKRQKIPDGAFPANEYAKQRKVSVDSMRRRLNKLVNMGLAEVFMGESGPNRVRTKFYRIKPL